MADLDFHVSATARGAGPEREGVLSLDGLSVPFSSPASMGGKKPGASPETLLLSAVTACYCLTLLSLLRKRQLPAEEITVGTGGVVGGFPRELVFRGVTVSPVIRGGDPARGAEYAAAAAEARTLCFIGNTVANGGVSYELGDVQVQP